MVNQTKERPIILTADEVNAVLAGDKTQNRMVLTTPSLGNPQFMGSRDCDEGLASNWGWEGFEDRDHLLMTELDCPFGKIGDRLWVQEDWRVGAWREIGGVIAIDYKASPEITNTPWVQIDNDDDGKKFESLWIALSNELDSKGIKTNDEGHYHWPAGKAPLDWNEASNMERWASRLLLEITDIRIERIRDISEVDAKAAGLHPDYCDHKYQICEDIGCVGKWVGALELDFKRKNGYQEINVDAWVWVIEFKVINASEAVSG